MLTIFKSTLNSQVVIIPEWCKIGFHCDPSGALDSPVGDALLKKTNFEHFQMTC